MEINIIRSIAWSFNRTTGLDWEELFGQASLYYVEALQMDIPEGVKDTTWAYRVTMNHLITYCKREGRRRSVVNVSPSEELPEVIIDTTPFFELYDCLSDDSKAIVDMILEAPTDYAKLPSKMARGLVVTNLIEKQGWIHSRVWEAVCKIKQELQTI